MPSIVLVQVHRAGEAEGDEERDGLGSGVVINEDGDILTSLHVVTQSLGITVTFADGTGVSADVIAEVP
ncbi:MAG: peptidase S1, partial [Caldilineaceae bacterium]|nr:peptidase S1 [Caldilineaceae bacterium]